MSLSNAARDDGHRDQESNAPKAPSRYHEVRADSGQTQSVLTHYVAKGAAGVEQKICSHQVLRSTSVANVFEANLWRRDSAG